MSLCVLAVGSLKTSWAKDACAQYLGRLGIEIVELSASKQKDPKKQQKEECEAIVAALEKRAGITWILDERGVELTSTALADQLQNLRDSGQKLTIVLGGAYGLNDAVRAKGDKILCLSSMTLPHELCRVLLLEQLYRADQICKGTGYHH